MSLREIGKFELFFEGGYVCELEGCSVMRPSMGFCSVISRVVNGEDE
jgi:hypothetical protein